MRSMLIAALLGCAVAVPGSAHAQLGGLGKKIVKKAGVVPAAETTVKTGKVSFDAQVLELTDVRISQFLKGLAAEQQMAGKVEAQDTEGIERRNAAKQAAHDKAWDEYQRKREAWGKCAEPEQQRAEKEMQGYGASVTDTVAMQKIAERMKAAQAAGDMATIQRLADSVGKASMAVASKSQAMASDANAGILKKCGQQPEEPAKPTLEPMLTFQDIRDAGLKASGFDGGQYAIMRERILPYVASKGRNSGGMVYTEQEAKALEARLADLTQYAEIIQKY